MSLCNWFARKFYPDDRVVGYQSKDGKHLFTSLSEKREYDQKTRLIKLRHTAPYRMFSYGEERAFEKWLKDNYSLIKKIVES